MNKRGEVRNKNISKTVHKIKEPSIVLPFTINEYRTAD
ncbi:thiamine transporter [Bacillus cereus]|nr:thiamine transporter [Bacillus cereus]